MRLEKIEENEKVQHHQFLDFIDCGWCYSLTEWVNKEKPAVTLNQSTVLEDLCKKHGGSINYSKLCGTTFHMYESDNGKRVWSGNLDEVLSRTKIDPDDKYYDTQLLKALITGVGLEELTVASRIVRWSDKGSSRGEDWYRLVKNLER